MTVRFRIEEFTLTTTEGEVRYSFPSDLTVLAGPTGVGKTTLLELIKFALGGDARLAPVAVDHVNQVAISITAGESRYQIIRSLDSGKRKNARVFDLVEQVRLRDHSVGTEDQPTLNTLLLSAIGLPDNMRAAAGNSSREGARITFADVLAFLYVPQYEVNRDIAHSQESYREPKRRAVFELLFRITNSHILALQSRYNGLKGQIDTADTRLRTVVQFLEESGTTGRIEAMAAFDRSEYEVSAAEQELLKLREAIEPVADRETQVIRDLLAEAERDLGVTSAAHTEAIRRQSEYAAEQKRVQSDIDRLSRMRDAGERLANIEFTVCPRCMQSLHRQVPDGTCRVCLQADTIEPSELHDQYEARQLQSQLDEVGDQLRLLGVQRTLLESAMVDRRQLIDSLGRTLESRTTDRITPRLQAFSDASQLLASAKTRRELLGATLRQWDQVEDLDNDTNQLRAERERIKSEIRYFKEELANRKAVIIAELSEEFASTLTAIRVPSIRTAAIDPDKYLPVINGQIYYRAIQLGGGVATAIQVAYWSSVLAVALRNRDTDYPAFLLLDSPRLALNSAEALTAALYRRLVAQADANPGRVQFIIADNQLPAAYRSHFAQVDFTYDEPTVSTIDHPGEGLVSTIGEPDSSSADETTEGE